MVKVYTILFSLLIFGSCHVTKNLSGKTFKYKSKKRTLQLVFDNDTICRLKNIFYCSDIDSGIKEITTVCRYKRINDTLYLKNIDCNSDTCSYDLTIFIPPQQSKQCSFLNKNERKRDISFGPNYTTEYQKYGLVPNIDVDTLYVVKNKIMLYKQNKKMSVGFIFK